MLYTKHVFKENLLNAIDKVLSSGRVITGEARSLQEKILHQAEGYDGRIGRGQVLAFTDHIWMGSPFTSSQLRNNLRSIDCYARLHR